MIIAIIQERYYKNKVIKNSFIVQNDEEAEKIAQEVIKEILHIDNLGRINNGISNVVKIELDTENTIKSDLLNNNFSDHMADQSISSRHFYKSMIENDKFDENLFVSTETSNKKNKIFEFNLNVLKYRLKKLYFHTKEV